MNTGHAGWKAVLDVDKNDIREWSLFMAGANPKTSCTQNPPSDPMH